MEEENPSETLQLIGKPPPNQPKKQPPSPPPPPHPPPTLYPTKTTPFTLLIQPFQWLQMLCKQLNPTFILGIALVYGLSQGFSNSFFKVVTDFYWKDVQKVQPSVVQLYIGFYYIPWIMKPVWGLLTDVFPVMGYRRRPYFVAAGVIGTVSAAVVAISGNLPVAVALGCLIGITAGVAIADVTIDACIARNSIEIRSLAADMQSFSGFCSSAGALLGYSSSGFFVHHLGAQGALGILVAPPAMLVVLGFVIYESRAPNLASNNKRKEFVGMIYAVGALASILGILIYHKTLKDCPFRTLLFFAQLIYAISGILDVIFILRWNLALGVPDYLFVVMEECISRVVARVRWMPMIILSTKLCPLGIEGTFFALLMCIDSLGSLSSKWAGGMVLHLLHVTRLTGTLLY